MSKFIYRKTEKTSFLHIYVCGVEATLAEQMNKMIKEDFIIYFKSPMSFVLLHVRHWFTFVIVCDIQGTSTAGPDLFRARYAIVGQSVQEMRWNTSASSDVGVYFCMWEANSFKKLG